MFRRSDDVILRSIADETLLVPIRGHLVNLQYIFTLDPVGEAIWRRLDAARSLDDLVTGVCDEFDVERPRAERDCREFLQALVDAQLAEAVTP